MKINPRQLQQAMKQFGVKQEDIQATEVIIKTLDKDFIISNPHVAKVKMMGEESFQITGTITERSRQLVIQEEDITTVSEQANVSKEEAERAIREHNGDLAAAILSLTT